MIKTFTRDLPEIYSKYRFDPLITAQMKNVIETELQRISENSDYSEYTETVSAIMELLGQVSETDEENLIITYEIIYNVAEGNTSILEIAEYISRNKLSVSFESLGKFIDSDSDLSDSASRIKSAVMWKTLYGLQTYDIDVNVNFPDWSWSSGTLWGYISEMFATSSIAIKVRNYGSIMGYIKDHNYFYPEIKTTDEDDDFIAAKLSDFMLTPIYSASGKLGTYKNERCAVEAYYSKLKTLNIDTPEFSNSIFQEMWRLIATDRTYKIGLYNDRTYNVGSLLYTPAVREAVYDSKIYNDLLTVILNAPYRGDAFQPYLGYDITMAQLKKYADALIENTDKANTAIKSEYNNILAKVAKYTKTLADASLQSTFESLWGGNSTYTIGDHLATLVYNESTKTMSGSYESEHETTLEFSSIKPVGQTDGCWGSWEATDADGSSFLIVINADDGGHGTYNGMTMHYTNDNYTFTIEREYSASEAIARCKDAISQYQGILGTLASLIVNWYDPRENKGFLYKHTFDQMYKSAFARKFFTNIDDWNEQQFLYSLAGFFEYDTSGEAAYMNSMYTDMKKFGVGFRSLAQQLAE